MIEVCKVRGKGRGLIAQRDIYANTILARDPVIVQSRAQYDACYDHKIGQYAFAYGLRRGAKRYAAIALGLSSLANHDDDPNCTWHFDPQNERIVLTATRRIRKGEELTVSYGWGKKTKERLFGKK